MKERMLTKVTLWVSLMMVFGTAALLEPKSISLLPLEEPKKIDDPVVPATPN